MVELNSLSREGQHIGGHYQTGTTYRTAFRRGVGGNAGHTETPARQKIKNRSLNYFMVELLVQVYTFLSQG